MTINLFTKYYPGMKIKRFLLIILLITAASTAFCQNTARLLEINKYLVARADAVASGKTAQFVDLSNYIMTPGDIYNLYISTGINLDSNSMNSLSYPMILADNYMLNVPIIGDVNVKGKKIREVEDQIEQKFDSRNVIYQFLSLQLKSQAMFDVIVHGQVNLPGIKPGTPEISLTDVLSLSGGLSRNASYRRIELKRGSTVYYYDLSEFYYNGDISQNPKMQPGDAVFIPEYEVAVTVYGKIRYPGIYELITGETFEKLLSFSGDYTDNSIAEKIEINRTEENGEESFFQIPVNEVNSFVLEDGDFIYVPSVFDTQDSIIIKGAILNGTSAGTANKSEKINVFPFRSGITLLSVLMKSGGPSPFALLEDCIIQRKNSDEEISVDLNRLWVERDRSFDIELFPGDNIYIPVKDNIMPIFVAGQVNKPGAIPYTPGLTVGEYLLYAGGIDANSADPNGMFFFDTNGSKVKTSLDTVVLPGQNILVDKTVIDKADDVMQKFFIVTTWATIIIGLTSSIIELIGAINN